MLEKELRRYINQLKCQFLSLAITIEVPHLFVRIYEFRLSKTIFSILCFSKSLSSAVGFNKNQCLLYHFFSSADSSIFLISSLGFPLIFSSEAFFKSIFWISFVSKTRMSQNERG